MGHIMKSCTREMFKFCQIWFPLRARTLGLLTGISCHSHFGSKQKIATHFSLRISSAKFGVLANTFNVSNYSTVAHDDVISQYPVNVWKFTPEINNLLTLNRPLSHTEWENLEKTAIENGMEQSVFESHVVGVCLNNKNYEAARSLLDYLEKLERIPNIVTLSRFMRLCGKEIETVGEEVILSTYRKLCELNIPFDTTVLSHIIYGLAPTSQWKECLKLLVFHDEQQNPNPHLYNVVCGAAFINNDIEVGENLLEKMLVNNMLPSGHTFINWIDSFKSSNTTTNFERLVEFTDFCEKCLVYLPKKVVDHLQHWCISNLDGHWEGKYVRIPFSGICPHCLVTLQSNAWTDKENELFGTMFVERIISETDKYFRIVPQEYEELKKTIEDFYPYDFVVDAASLAYYQNEKLSRGIKQNQLCSALNSLRADKQKKILVIAPLSMSFWKGSNMDYIRRKTKWFYSQSYSASAKIIAALYGGSNTKLICNNFLTNYHYGMDNTQLSSLLKRWRLNNVISFQRACINEDIEFLPPVTFNPVMQMTQSAIHIPCTNHLGPTVTSQLPNKWLCLKTDLHSDTKNVKKKFGQLMRRKFRPKKTTKKNPTNL